MLYVARLDLLLSPFRLVAVLTKNRNIVTYLVGN